MIKLYYVCSKAQSIYLLERWKSLPNMLFKKITKNRFRFIHNIVILLRQKSTMRHTINLCLFTVSFIHTPSPYLALIICLWSEFGRKRSERTLSTASQSASRKGSGGRSQRFGEAPRLQSQHCRSVRCAGRHASLL